MKRRDLIGIGFCAGIGLLPARAAFAQDPLVNLALGRADAPRIVEDFSSMTCPHCAAFALSAFDPIRAELVETGRVRWVMRDFPLDRMALLAAKLVRSRRPADRYALRRFLFAEQPEWALDEAKLASLVEGAGIGARDFAAIRDDDALSREVLSERIWGAGNYGVSATPSFVLSRRGASGFAVRRGRMNAALLTEWMDSYGEGGPSPG